MGSFGCKLYLVVYLFACFIESNNVLYQVSFICLLYSVSFSIRFHAQCFIHNANLFSAVYQACTKLSLGCCLHWFSTRSACVSHLLSPNRSRANDVTAWLRSRLKGQTPFPQHQSVENRLWIWFDFIDLQHSREVLCCELYPVER